MVTLSRSIAYLHHHESLLLQQNSFTDWSLNCWTVTHFVILPLHTITVDFKSNKQDLIEVQTFSFHSRVRKILHWMLYWLLYKVTIFRRLKWIGWLMHKQFHGQVKPFPFRFHDNGSRHIRSWFNALNMRSKKMQSASEGGHHLAEKINKPSESKNFRSG